ncbi:MAG: hypothetical protein U0835_17170 [Isosphaeraceae bacterium]
MFPRITQHFSVGMLVGLGLGLVVARTLAELRIDLAGMPGNVLTVVGLAATAAGWSLYRSDLRKSRVADPSKAA